MFVTLVLINYAENGSYKSFKERGVTIMNKQLIQITKDQAKKYLELMEFAEYQLLNESHEKMLDYRLAAIELRKQIESQGGNQ